MPGCKYVSANCVEAMREGRLSTGDAIIMMANERCALSNRRRDII